MKVFRFHFLALIASGTALVVYFGKYFNERCGPADLEYVIHFAISRIFSFPISVKSSLSYIAVS